MSGWVNQQVKGPVGWIVISCSHYSHINRINSSWWPLLQPFRVCETLKKKSCNIFLLFFLCWPRRRRSVSCCCRFPGLVRTSGALVRRLAVCLISPSASDAFPPISKISNWVQDFSVFSAALDVRFIWRENFWCFWFSFLFKISFRRRSICKSAPN